MADIIPIPDSFECEGFNGGVLRSDNIFAEGDEGVNETDVRAPPRWTAQITSEQRMPDWLTTIWMSLIIKLNGAINRLAIYDIYRPQPLGSFRGAPTCYASVTAGSKQFVMDGSVTQAGKTIKEGDWVGVKQTGNNRQVVYVTQDAVADSNGRITLNFQPYLRDDLAAGEAIVLVKPTWLGQLQNQQGGTSWRTTTGYNGRGGMDLSFVEAWLL